jgi:hypothetical protein
MTAALNGVSWAQSGSVEIAVGQTDRMLQNRRHHLLPPTGVAPLGSSVRPRILLSAPRLGRRELGAVLQQSAESDRSQRPSMASPSKRSVRGACR